MATHVCATDCPESQRKCIQCRIDDEENSGKTFRMKCPQGYMARFVPISRDD